MREQDNDDKTEQEQLISKQQEDLKLKQDDFDLKRDRAIEEFNITRQDQLNAFNIDRADRLQDYENRRREETDNYARSLSSQASYEGMATQVHQDAAYRRATISLEEAWKRKQAAEVAAQAEIDAQNRVRNALQAHIQAYTAMMAKYPYLPTDKYSSWASGGPQPGNMLLPQNWQKPAWTNGVWSWEQSQGIQRAFGGMVPGALGSPQFILAHGGERITPPATSNYYNNVRAGNQVSINAPMTFTNNVTGANSGLIIQQAARELSRSISMRKGYGN